MDILNVRASCRNCKLRILISSLPVSNVQPSWKVDRCLLLSIHQVKYFKTGIDKSLKTIWLMIDVSPVYDSFSILWLYSSRPLMYAYWLYIKTTIKTLIQIKTRKNGIHVMKTFNASNHIRKRLTCMCRAFIAIHVRSLPQIVINPYLFYTLQYFVNPLLIFCLVLPHMVL